MNKVSSDKNRIFKEKRKSTKTKKEMVPGANKKRKKRSGNKNRTIKTKKHTELS